MSVTVAGVVVAADGCALWRYEDMWGEQRVAAIESTPSSTFGDLQPACEVRLGHGGQRVGDLCYLEAGIVDDALRFVAVIDADGIEARDVDGLYVSPSITSLMAGIVSQRSRLDEVAIVRQTANVGVGAITAVDGDYRRTHEPGRHPWHTCPTIVDRAVRAHQAERTEQRSARNQLRIHRPVVAVPEWRGASPPPGVAIEWSAPVSNCIISVR